MATDYETLGTTAYSLMPMNYSVISATHSVCRFPNAKSAAERVGFRVRRIFLRLERKPRAQRSGKKVNDRH